jgi:hypothetical protein
MTLAEYDDVVRTSRRRVPMTRSAIALACGGCARVNTVVIPPVSARRTKPPPPQRSWSRMRKRGCTPQRVASRIFCHTRACVGCRVAFGARGWRSWRDDCSRRSVRGTGRGEASPRGDVSPSVRVTVSWNRSRPAQRPPPRLRLVDSASTLRSAHGSGWRVPCAFTCTPRSRATTSSNAIN